MILGVGVDVCEIARIERAMAARSGRHFQARVFLAGEVAYCEARGRTRAQSYAATFAAKEAVLKAFGTGWAQGLGWHTIEVVHGDDGAPAVVLRGVALGLARRRGVRRVHVTLSHGGGLAVAVAVLEGRGLRRPRRTAAGASARMPRPKSRRRSR